MLLLHRLPDGVDFFRERPPVVGGQVDQNCAVRHDRAVPAGQLFDYLREIWYLGDAVQSLQAGQDGLQLLRGEKGFVELVCLCNGYAAAPALDGDQRNAGLADVLDVPVDGAAGHLELLGQVGGGDGLLLLQGGDDANQAVYFHECVGLSSSVLS